jgi:hypothetical protein
MLKRLLFTLALAVGAADSGKRSPRRRASTLSANQGPTRASIAFNAS